MPAGRCLPAGREGRIALGQAVLKWRSFEVGGPASGLVKRTGRSGRGVKRLAAQRALGLELSPELPRRKSKRLSEAESRSGEVASVRSPPRPRGRS